MKEQENKSDWNSIAGKPKPKQATAHEADPNHAAVKHAGPLGRVEIAPAKPVWPPKK